MGMGAVGGGVAKPQLQLQAAHDPTQPTAHHARTARYLFPFIALSMHILSRAHTTHPHATTDWPTE